jgi:hypothetical protein
MKPPLKIISGGQTGVDRAALEWALANGVPHGGWCPKGRMAEDGLIPPQFQLKETGSDNYSIRTRRNVRDSGGTVIFSASAELAGGTQETLEYAKEVGKPWLHLVSSSSVNLAATHLEAFVRQHNIRVLNVAGPRASVEPETGQFVKAVLSRALKPREEMQDGAAT